jgi:hypothetical protein
MNNQDRKQSAATVQIRPTREDMIAFVANGRQRPNAEWALCIGGRPRDSEDRPS